MQRTRYWKLAVLALPLCASCGRNSAPTPTPAKPIVSSTYKAQQTDAIREALLRSFVFGDVYGHYSRGVRFVKFSDEPDPSPAFIQRMRAHGIRVQKKALSPEPLPKGRGAVLSIWIIHWLSPSRVEVRVDTSGGGTKYTLALKNGKWAVVEQMMVRVS